MRLAVLALIAIALSAAASAGACGGDGGPLQGSAWALTTLGGKPSLPEVSPILRFESGGKVTGSTGCNSLSGTWKSSGSKLSLTEIATTLIGCPGPIGEQEQAFNAALIDTSSYTIDAATLTLTGDDGMPRMTLRRLAGSPP